MSDRWLKSLVFLKQSFEVNRKVRLAWTAWGMTLNITIYLNVKSFALSESEVKNGGSQLKT